MRRHTAVPNVEVFYRSQMIHVNNLSYSFLNIFSLFIEKKKINTSMAKKRGKQYFDITCIIFFTCLPVTLFCLVQYKLTMHKRFKPDCILIKKLVVYAFYRFILILNTEGKYDGNKKNVCLTLKNILIISILDAKLNISLTVTVSPRMRHCKNTARKLVCI